MNQFPTQANGRIARAAGVPRVDARQIQLLFTRYKILALLFAVALIWLFFWSQTHGTFLTPRSLSNLFLQMSVTGMLACGMVFVIIAGEIDLSVGSLLGLLGGLVAILTVNLHWPTWPAVIVVLIAGTLIGMLNGFITTRMRIPSFIVGLGGMLAFRGVLQWSTNSVTIAPVPDDLVSISQGFVPVALSWGLAAVVVASACFFTVRRRRNRARMHIASSPFWADALRLLVIAAAVIGFVAELNRANGVPIPVLILLILLAIFSYIAMQTVFGRHVYAVGGNLEATRLSGVNVNRVKLAVFALMGLMCAFAGIVTTARSAAGSPSAGDGGELDAISACFIGGTSMRGGSGTVYGALIGALVMASLDNGMEQMNVDSSWQMIVKGLVLVLAVWVDVLSGSSRN
ncbi:sugar ABC transporter permease [Bordetella sp. FB-8]|uniref:sugar ABC transporter permease n=1 Tax=Bordetella sp. FB-8 TaxID=1159870 RepID=UPI000379898D|nr:sugar ABC transporter permease [Bordetella sp. FB-8]